MIKNPFSFRAVLNVFDDCAGDTRGKIVGIYTFLVALNLVAWGLAFVAFASKPILLGTALLAYTFGLRHSVDADHISAIDNVTRKLMQEGKRPVAVGFFFSLGHSTIVVALSVAIAIAASTIKHSIPSLQSIGGLIGTSVSAAFLFLIATINMFVLAEIFRTFQAVRRGEPLDEETLEGFLSKRGLIGRIFRPLLHVVGASWRMYPLGILFGLGFDTATEIGLLGIAAVQAGNGLSIWSILIFPLLFTAGMCLLDTTDGILMLGAYGWAFVKPMRKLYYNLNITLVSVLVALAVGGIEALSVASGQLHLTGGFWQTLSGLSGNFGTLGFIIIAIFCVSWGVSTAIYKLRRYDDIDVQYAKNPVVR